MNVLVDTSVWSLALRRRNPVETSIVLELRELILEKRARLIGPIRQEILSGIRAEEHFQRLLESLRPFPDQEVTSEDFERAAELFNRCRRKGVQGSNTDFLLCAVAIRLELAIFTTDRDFSFFADHLPIRLHHARPVLE